MELPARKNFDTNVGKYTNDNGLHVLLNVTAAQNSGLARWSERCA